VTRPVRNPPNPWLSEHVELLGEPPAATLEVHEERGRSIVAENDSPDVPFRFSVNPYRGCQHACAYCYARPSHELLGWGAGTDFDTRIVVKLNAPELLESKLASRGWTRELIAFSGVTDCYQPLEASYELTRRCLQACLRHRQPVAVITKSALVRRDAELLAGLERASRAVVFVSIGFVDEEQARLIEPFAPPPAVRLATIEHLARAGVPTGVLVAPVIPGLNDEQVAEILRRAAQAGARRAGLVPLRLPAEVAPVFEERLRAALPLRAEHVLSAVREMRGGKLNDPRFGARFGGRGPRWAAIEQLFLMHCRRLGLQLSERGEKEEAPPPPDRQGLLFGREPPPPQRPAR